MNKLVKLEGPYVAFKCPGCRGPQTLPVPPEPQAWEWNGSMERPTFKPSILTTCERPTKGKFICHSYVIDGRIRFLGDCTHALAGKTVDLPDVTDEASLFYGTGEK